MDTRLPEKQAENIAGDGTGPRGSIDEAPAAAARSPLTSRILSSLSEQGSIRSRSPLRDEWHMHDPHHHYGPRHRPYHRRPKSPSLAWHKAYTDKNITHGRVLVIDYVKQELSKDGMRKVAALEINSLESLQKWYNSSSRRDEAVLRFFHVQNADWAVHFFFKKFNLKPNDLVGSDFGKYAKYTKPERRGGRPLLKARLWPTQHDPWRKISLTAFSFDYLKTYKVLGTPQSQQNAYGKFMELNCFDENDNPRYGWDVYPQRTSCYIQLKEDEMSEAPSDPEISNPYEKDPTAIEDMDNGTTIILFENSKTCSIQDTLIPARQEWESRWRRLPFYLAYENHDVSRDDELAVQCMRLIVQDIWTSLSQSWERLLDIADHHIAILEDKIFEQPADESRADEIWLNSNNWLKVERLVLNHSNVVQQLNINLRELVESAADNPWLEASTQAFETLSARIQENLVKPTDSLSDLMYKSVGIRDTRHSLELSYSMWRLSWITFIFLPLTFTVGFFGMNVDTFANDPSLKWYFIAAAPMMVLVLIFYWIFKHQFARNRQTPYSRGIYEHFFHELSAKYPLLWTRGGPRENVSPRGRWERFKWHMIQTWNEPEKTIKNPLGRDEDQFDGLGTWEQFKRMLTRRWTEDLDTAAKISSTDPIVYEEAPRERFANAVEDVVNIIHPPTANGDATGQDHTSFDPSGLKVPSGIDQRVNARVNQRLSLASSGGRPSSQGTSSIGRNSGIMVEEERPDWLCSKD